jgi:hypothetical protein
LDLRVGAQKLAHYFRTSFVAVQVLARACGHSSISDVNQRDITMPKNEMAE